MKLSSSTPFLCLLVSALVLGQEGQKREVEGEHRVLATQEIREDINSRDSGEEAVSSRVSRDTGARQHNTIVGDCRTEHTEQCQEVQHTSQEQQCSQYREECSTSYRTTCPAPRRTAAPSRKEKRGRGRREVEEEVDEKEIEEKFGEEEHREKRSPIGVVQAVLLSYGLSQQSTTTEAPVRRRPRCFYLPVTTCRQPENVCRTEQQRHCPHTHRVTHTHRGKRSPVGVLQAILLAQALQQQTTTEAPRQRPRCYRTPHVTCNQHPLSSSSGQGHQVKVCREVAVPSTKRVCQQVPKTVCHHG